MKAWVERLLGRTPPVPLLAARWVVVDCETGGLDAARDPLLSVAAVAVRGGCIALGESFSAVLRQDAPSDPANILVHRIGGEAQRGGRPAAQALREFAEFVADGLPVAFHAPFDEAALRRAMAGAGLQAPRPWLDLAGLAPALNPEPGAARRALDDWLVKYGIDCPERHEALADAYATAQLLLVLLAQAERQGAGTVDALRRLERSGRWLGPG